MPTKKLKIFLPLFGLLLGLFLSEGFVRIFESTLLKEATDDKPRSILAPNELSILIAGESTAGGEPFYNTPPRTIIQYYLSRFAPSLSPKFEEVVRFGGSLRRTYQDLVKSIERLEPQIVVTMFGNNDYLGEYSADKACDEKSLGFLHKLARHSALIRLTVERLFPESVEGEPNERLRTFLDEPVVCGDEAKRLENTHADLLRKISKITKEEGGTLIPVFLASNDVDFDPNRSVFLGDESRIQEFSDLFTQGYNSLKDGALKEALISFLEAHKIDQTFAYLNFVIGRTYLSLKEFDKAREFLELATEYDGFPYRTKPSFRKRLVKEAKGRGDPYIDFSDSLKGYAPFQILDGRFFGDIHHPTLEGYNILAFEITKRIKILFPDFFVTDPYLISLDEVRDALSIDQSVWFEVALHNLTWTDAYRAMSFEPSHRNEVIRRNLSILKEIDSSFVEHIVSPERQQEIEELSRNYPKDWRLSDLKDLWSGFSSKISSKYTFKGFTPLAFHSFLPVTSHKNLDGSFIKLDGKDVEGFILHPWADRSSAVLIDLENKSFIEGSVSVAITGTAASTIKCSLEVDGTKLFETDTLNIKSPPVHFSYSIEGRMRGMLLCNDASDGNAFDHVLVSGLNVR